MRNTALFRSLLFTSLLLSSSVGYRSSFADEPASSVKARPFALDRVTLLDSPFHRAMEINQAYLLRFEPDRLLWPFHERAKLPIKGARYGGWEKKDVVGSMAGHYLTACSLMYAATRDDELKKRVDYMVAEIARAQVAPEPRATRRDQIKIPASFG